MKKIISLSILILSLLKVCSAQSNNQTWSLRDLKTEIISNGKYYYDNDGKADSVEMTEFTEAGPFKMNFAGKIRKFKRSSFISNLYYEPTDRTGNMFYLRVDNEQGIISFFTANPDNASVDQISLLSKDKNVVNLDSEIQRASLEKTMSDLKLKRDGKFEAEAKARVDKREMPTAKMLDAALTASALKCMNDYSDLKNWENEFTQAVIVSEAWYISKNRYTGAILHREIEVACLFKLNGKCYLEYYMVKQDYEGSSYQKNLQYNGVVMGHDMGGDEINCDKTTK